LDKIAPMPFTVKEIQPTPNPNAAKFILDREISTAPFSFLSAKQGEAHPIASQLFGIKGVTSILILGDFVTVNKTPDAHWKQITPKVQEILENCD
jgi:hypothetical protein